MIKFNSITTKQIFFITTLAVFIATLVFKTISDNVGTQMLDYEKQKLIQIVDNEADILKKVVDDSQKQITNLSFEINNLQNQNNSDEKIDNLIRNFNITKKFDFISIFDSQGYITHSDTYEYKYFIENREKNNFSFRNYVKQALAGQNGEETAVGRDTGQLGVFLSVPIRDKSDQVVGGILVKLNFSNIVNYIDQPMYKFYDNYYFIDDNGVILATNESEQYLTSIVDISDNLQNKLINQDKKYPLLNKSNKNLPEIFAIIKNYENPRNLVINNDIYSIVKIKNLDLFLITKKQPNEITNFVNFISSKIAQILVFSVALFLIVTGYFLILSVKPLKELINAIENIKSGNYSYRITKNFTSEFNSVVTAFNELIELLYQKNNKVEVEFATKNEELKQQTSALLNVVDDIQTEKEKVYKAMFELKKFKLAVENSSDLITITDKEGIVVYINSSVEKMTGFTQKEAMGHKAGTLWGKLMTDDFYKNLWDTIKVEKKTFKAKIDNHKKNGERFIAEITITPLLDDDGEIQFFVSVQRDINREEQIEKIKNEFISIASHQLRTPLSAIKWYLEMLKDQNLENKNDEPEIIKNIEQSNERMITLVNSLLNISRIESGRMEIKPQITKLDELVKDVKQEFDNIAEEKNINIALNLDENLEAISIDPKLIREVYKNLVSNAIKYSNPDTTIKIEVFKKNNFIESRISDKGYGIPIGEKDKIFEKFYRAKNVIKLDVEGNGLGLYLTKAIVEASGGKIWFESVISMGTTFFFTLPLSGSPENKGQVSIDPEPIK